LTNLSLSACQNQLCSIHSLERSISPNLELCSLSVDWSKACSELFLRIRYDILALNFLTLSLQFYTTTAQTMIEYLCIIIFLSRFQKRLHCRQTALFTINQYTSSMLFESTFPKGLREFCINELTIPLSLTRKAMGVVQT
jgi:hypothetical protein